MKLFLVILLTALCPLLSRGQMVLANGSLANATAQSTASTPAVPTYLVDEDFEGTGTPTDWFTLSTLWGFDTSTSGLSLEGSQCASTASTFLRDSIITNWTGKTEIWARFLTRRTDVTSTSGAYAFLLRDYNSNIVANITYATDGKFRCYAGSAYKESLSAISSNTTYVVFFYYKAGSGANAEAYAAFTTDGIKPSMTPNSAGALWAYPNSGNSTTAANQLMIYSQYLAGTKYVDEILLDDAEIANR